MKKGSFAADGVLYSVAVLPWTELTDWSEANCWAVSGCPLGCDSSARTEVTSEMLLDCRESQTTANDSSRNGLKSQWGRESCKANALCCVFCQRRTHELSHDMLPPSFGLEWYHYIECLLAKFKFLGANKERQQSHMPVFEAGEILLIEQKDSWVFVLVIVNWDSFGCCGTKRRKLTFVVIPWRKIEATTWKIVVGSPPSGMLYWLSMQVL